MNIDEMRVHPVLRTAAAQINEHLSDDGRQQLWALAPRLMGTASGDEEQMQVIGVQMLCRLRPTEHVLRYAHPAVRAAWDATSAWADHPCEEHRLRAEALAQGAAYAAAAYEDSYELEDADSRYEVANTAYEAVSYVAWGSGSGMVARDATLDAIGATPDPGPLTYEGERLRDPEAAWVALLTGMLDEYDRRIGRTTGTPISS